MKAIHLLAAAFLLMTACENPVQLTTRVHEDGSMDKTILFQKTDSGRVMNNMFGVSARKGWQAAVRPMDVAPPKGNSTSSQMDELGKNKSHDGTTKEAAGKIEYQVSFQKHFVDAESANAELDTPADSLFHIRTTIDKKFRWFYTYLRYTETFRPINRFKKADPKEFFTQEDFTFIHRLPSEGQRISKADSLYLQLLNKKISDNFAERAIYEEEMGFLLEAVRQSGLGKVWEDTLYRRREYIYQQLEKMTGDPDFAVKMADSLKIPIKKSAWLSVEAANASFNTRLSFMSFAHDGKYQNSVEMPWEIVSTNADSVAGNVVYWKPLVNKFIFEDYAMYVESRSLNLWSIGLSLLIMIGTARLLFRKRERPGKVK